MRRALLLIPVLALVFASSGFSQDKGKLSLLAYVDYFYNIQRDPAFGSLSNTALGGGEAFQAFQFAESTLPMTMLSRKTSPQGSAWKRTNRR